MKLKFGKNINNLKLVGMILITVSVLEFAGGIYFYQKTSTFLETARKTTGQVVELITNNTSKNKKTYAPVFTFQDSRGKTHKIKSAYSSSSPSYEVGQEVDVFFNPQMPEEAILGDFFEVWGATVIFMTMATITFLVSSIILFVENRKRKILKK